jgi:hypothetical protein
MFMHRIKISGHRLRGVVVGCSVSWWAMLHFVAVGIVSHDVYSWDQINSQKTTHQIYRICSARVNCAMASARSLCLCEAHVLAMMLITQFFSNRYEGAALQGGSNRNRCWAELGLGSFYLQDLAIEVSKLPRKFSNRSRNVPEGSFFLLEMAPGNGTAGFSRAHLSLLD